MYQTPLVIDKHFKESILSLINIECMLLLIAWVCQLSSSSVCITFLSGAILRQNWILSTSPTLWGLLRMATPGTRTVVKESHRSEDLHPGDAGGESQAGKAQLKCMLWLSPRPDQP